MFILTYASSAINRLSKPELFALLERSRAKNTRLNITGLLLYKDGNFLQALEGEEADVQQLMTTIKADPLHRGVIVLMEKQTETREFAGWSMAFRHLNDEVRNIEGYSEFLNMPLSPHWLADHTSEVQALLKVFHKMHSH